VKRLDQISNEDVQGIKPTLGNRKPKTVNNVLTVLGNALRVAVKWKVIATMPCTIDLLKVSNLQLTFYEFDEYARLIRAAEKIDLRTLVVVLLGGDAGLRRGEMIALRWCDVDFTRRQLHIRQSVWHETTDTPKSGRGRIVPMTAALATGLHRYRHLRGERVLYDDASRPVRGHTLLDYHQAAQRRAGLQYTTGGLISFVIRFVRTWQCAAHRQRRSRNSLVTRTWRPRSGTCICHLRARHGHPSARRSAE
jgi:integrase